MHNNMLTPQTSSRKSSHASTSTSSPPQRTPPASGHAMLNDMFLSQHVTGIRASIFHSSSEHLQFVSSLHGLDMPTTCNTRDLKLRLLFHIVNGDCFLDRCEASHPSPDRSACLSIAAGFSSSLAITEFIVQLLKASSSPDRSTSPCKHHQHHIHMSTILISLTCSIS